MADKSYILPGKNVPDTVAHSPIAIVEQKAYTPQGQMDYEVPIELTPENIKNVITDFKTARANAIKAGFFRKVSRAY